MCSSDLSQAALAVLAEVIGHDCPVVSLGNCLLAMHTRQAYGCIDPLCFVGYGRVPFAERFDCHGKSLSRSVNASSIASVSVLPVP